MVAAGKAVETRTSQADQQEQPTNEYVQAVETRGHVEPGAVNAISDCEMSYQVLSDLQEGEVTTEKHSNDEP